jgi:hypothetical protein
VRLFRCDSLALEDFDAIAMPPTVTLEPSAGRGKGSGGKFVFLLSRSGLSDKSEFAVKGLRVRDWLCLNLRALPSCPEISALAKVQMLAVHFALVASVAQLAEQLTLNQLVEGSSPSRGTIPPV